MGKALYRKYRSKSLAELAGQEHITTTLANAVKSGRISHAYLFTGPRGTGKTSVARILAHDINQLPYTDTQHLDIIEIDAASNRRIDDIRDLREKVHIAPISAKYKVYIIDEVHMLTGESFNALLKTLEEPPAHVVFILATTEVHKLPATIMSRTQRYSFRAAQPKTVITLLKQIAQKESITISDEALQLIAEHGAGSFRDSISLLDQLANVHSGTIDATAVEQNLGLAPKQAIEALLTSLLQKNHQAIAKQLSDLELHGSTAAALVPQLLHALGQKAVKHPEFYRLIDVLLEVPRAYNPAIKLTTALIGFTLDNLKQPEALKPNTVAQAAQPILEISKAPAELKKNAQKPEPVPQEGVKVSQILPEQWGQILEKIKVVSPPLHSVLKQAVPMLDVEKQVLTLKSKYKLHVSRLEEAKARVEIAKVLVGVLGGAPILNAELDVQAKPLPAISVQTPMDETTESVAAIMGGGEVVNA